MCDTSKVNDMLGGGGVAAATFSASRSVPTISAVKLRHERDKYYLIDIREAEEIAAHPLSPKSKREDDDDDDDDHHHTNTKGDDNKSDEDDGKDVAAAAGDIIVADVEVPMGKLLAAGVAEEWIDKQGIVLVCNTGYRAAITARELAATGNSATAASSKVMALQNGILGLRNPAATVPDMVVVLGTKSNAEKITLALSAAAAAAKDGETVVLALMGDGVCTFLRKGNNKELAVPQQSYRIEETFIGEPFQPCKTLMNKFISSGNGVILACTSCIKHRGIDFGSDLLDCVSPMQMPDLIRMLGQAKKSMQFM
uniref:Rhodanese domain-containing protein n=1 Tax=Amphora coffeiformis TaxID=265554 RepID=A0A7S3P2H5_9STRA|mmetsp:Transcript_9132/g.18370  ORF Transcript_9132/g.18370 Transcript_9132/m.18370 type:complete len:311 (+) Transcript_9132:168-1100(+)|eukprot:scaffold28_cov155-Amphora_coffeaeformis.AAC.1